MDTIIYVFAGKTDCSKEEYDMGDYRLVRLGISPELLRILQERDKNGVQGGKHGPGRTLLEKPARQNENRDVKHGFWRMCLREGKKGNKQSENSVIVIERKRLEQLRADFMQEMCKNLSRKRFVCEVSLPFLESWRFGDYLEEEWLLHMMRYAALPHFVILGRVHCMPRILLHSVNKMKSLRWILPGYLYGQKEQELVEDLCEQYGLVVDVQLLQTEVDYSRLEFRSRFPVNVLDLSEADNVSATGVPAGSIWLDMGACEIKKCRLEEHYRDIMYFSLKKEWNQPEKALFCLDTIGKNGYNT